MNDTQRYAVYHANDLLERHLPPAMRWYADKSMYYTHVADVVAPLEQIFALTNHIDHPWTDNPEVVWLAASRIRSTSVGVIYPKKLAVSQIICHAAKPVQRIGLLT